MLLVEVPGLDTYELEHLVLDVNGTISLDGELLPGVAEAVTELAAVLHVWAITADTRGTAGKLQEALGVQVKVIAAGDESAQKAAFVDELGPAGVFAVGNGANDGEMLREAAIGVAVLGPEGLARAALGGADLVVSDIGSALSLLLEPRRLIATLRR